MHDDPKYSTLDWWKCCTSESSRNATSGLMGGESIRNQLILRGWYSSQGSTHREGDPEMMIEELKRPLLFGFTVFWLISPQNGGNKLHRIKIISPSSANWQQESAYHCILNWTIAVWLFISMHVSTSVPLCEWGLRDELISVCCFSIHWGQIQGDPSTEEGNGMMLALCSDDVSISGEYYRNILIYFNS